MFGRATIRLGIGPHSSLLFFVMFPFSFFSVRCASLSFVRHKVHKVKTRIKSSNFAAGRAFE